MSKARTGHWRSQGFVLAILAGVGSVGCADIVTIPSQIIPENCDHDPASYVLDDVGAMGPYGVGHMVTETTYTPVEGGPERTIPVHIWYPTDADTSLGEVVYRDTDDILARSQTRDEGVLQDAEPAEPKDGCQFPVHMYSHGHIGWAGTGAHMAKFFASNGWVFVGPDHIGNTVDTNEDPRPWELYVWRPADISASIDALASLGGTHPLAGKFALDSVVAGGHSFGAYSTWSFAGASYDADAVEERCDGTCTAAFKARLAKGFADARIKAVITTGGSIDRAWFGEDGHSTVVIPMLDLSGTVDGAHEGTVEKWPSLVGQDLVRVDLEGGCHPTFETSPLICNTLDKEIGYQIVNTYTMAFAQRHILGDTGTQVQEILDGTTSVSDKATLLVR